jgi:HD-GYP domain-containing protein (c-di-GMP phosphodiesterase class II)
MKRHPEGESAIFASLPLAPIIEALSGGKIEELDRVIDLVNDLVPDDPVLRTKDHSNNSAIFAFRMSLVMVKRGLLDKDRVYGVCLGARLHDVGKDDYLRVLLKQKELSEDQKKELKLHSTYGMFGIWKFLDDNPLVDKFPVQLGALKKASWIAYYHHERMDGSGPNELKGDEIPMEARIVGVAEEFDSFVHGKKVVEDGEIVYRTQPMTQEEALKTMLVRPGKWDANALSALEEVVKNGIDMVFAKPNINQ